MFNRELKSKQRGNAAKFKETTGFRALFDLPLMTMIKRLPGIKKEYESVSFVGPNPYLFLNHIPPGVKKFYYAENSEEALQKSTEIIEERKKSGFYERLGV